MALETMKSELYLEGWVDCDLFSEKYAFTYSMFQLAYIDLFVLYQRIGINQLKIKMVL